MTTHAIAAKPPAGVTRETLWKKVANFARKNEKAMEQAVHIGDVLALTAVAGGTAMATAFLYKKFPEIATIPGTEIPSQPVVGGVLIVLGMIKKTKASYMLVALGLGILIPYLFDVGESIEFGD